MLLLTVSVVLYDPLDIKTLRRNENIIDEDANASEEDVIVTTNRPAFIKTLLELYKINNWGFEHGVYETWSLCHWIWSAQIENGLTGFGYFTEKNFQKDEVIGEYYGQILTEDEIKSVTQIQHYQIDCLHSIHLKK